MALSNFDDLAKQLHLMSNEELEELADKLQKIIDKNEERLEPPKEEDIDFHTELEELDFADDIQTFAELANTLDERGFFKAADKLDYFIKQRKCMDVNKRVAKQIRRQRRAGTKTAQVDIDALARRLRLDPDVLKQLSQQQLLYVSRIRNPALARQVITSFQQQPQELPTQHKVQPLPTQPKKPTPA